MTDTNAIHMRRQNRVLYIAFLLIFAVGLPLGNMLGLISDTTLNLWGRYLCFAIAALGIDLIWGYTGILSLCHALFFCIGGYGIGMHMLLGTGADGVYGSDLPDFMVWNQVEALPAFWAPFRSLPATMILILVVPAVIAAIFGFLAFRSRIKGVYFAIITQALALGAWLIFLRNETMLGGTNGLTDFKTLAGFTLQDPSTKRGLYLLTVLALVVIFAMARGLTSSKLGKLLVAVRDSENRVRFTGYDIASFKLFIFVVGAVIAAIGGMLYVPQTGIITPGRMDVEASILMVVWVAVGGRGSLTGAVIGALAVSLLYSVGTSHFPQYWHFVLGGLFIGVVRFFPDGLIGITPFIAERLRHHKAKKTQGFESPAPTAEVTK